MHKLPPHQPRPEGSPVIRLQRDRPQQPAGRGTAPLTGGVTAQFLPDEAAVGHAHAPGGLNQPFGIVEAQRRVGEVTAQCLQPFHQTLEEGLEAEAVWLEQATALDDPRRGQEVERNSVFGIRYSDIRPFADLPVGDGDIGHLHQIVAGRHHRLALAGERVFGPHFLHGEGSPTPAAIRLLRPAPDPSLLQPAHRQHDVREKLQRLGVEGQSKLKPLPGFVTEDETSVGQFDKVPTAVPAAANG